MVWFLYLYLWQINSIDSIDDSTDDSTDDSITDTDSDPTDDIKDGSAENSISDDGDDDYDDDGITNSEDDDDDNDGITDSKDSDDDNDGIPDSIDNDDDNDGIDDDTEIIYECASKTTEEECRSVHDDDDNELCNLARSTEDDTVHCVAVVRRAGVNGNGDYDDGYTAATNIARSDTVKYDIFL